MFKHSGWCWFLSGKEEMLVREKCGKWMYFFVDQDFAEHICQKAIDEEACVECKCTDMEAQQTPRGVICFYLNGDDVKAHKAILQFMLNNDLIRKTKNGKLFNISFKFDNQTRAGQYGADFEGQIKLDNFVDLYTGGWIHE